ncbi:MAG TPA: TolC family protein [Anaeromyxobacteraceae bacterium]|nr:TolC family protein [Anaeromyxobacteraceae bacterium]
MNVLGMATLALALAQAQGAGAPQQGTQAPPAAAAAAQPGPAAPQQGVAASNAAVAGQPQLGTEPLPPAGPLMTLDEALHRAERDNLDIQVFRARLDQAYQAAWKAWSYYLPQVSVGGTYTHNDVGVTIPFPTSYVVRDNGSPTSDQNGSFAGQPYPGSPTNFIAVPNSQGAEYLQVQKQDQLGAQVVATQALLAPSLWFTIPAAYKAQDVARLTLESARRDIIFFVAQAYYAVASLRQTFEISQRLLETAQRQEHDAAVRYKAGTIAKVGLLRAQIARAGAEQDVRRALNGYLSAKIALATLLDRGTDFEVESPAEPQLPPNPAGLEQTAARDRPEVQAARESVDVASGNRNAIVADYLPNVGAFGRYQWANVTGFTGTNTVWAVGLGLTWNIFDGGLREANLREANARIAEAEATWKAAELRARSEVAEALLDLESARANAQKSKEQRDLAAENQRLVDVSYRAGAATAVEQADATTALRNAELAFQTDSLQAQLSALRLLRAAGAFDPVPAQKR